MIPNPSLSPDSLYIYEGQSWVGRDIKVKSKSCKRKRKKSKVRVEVRVKVGVRV